tara:strand:+ start:398 stop:760 length:363 start_codon:yes stop_codon:yes gene_type:complete
MKIKKRILCFDIDNVICFTVKNNYQKSIPNHNIIKTINELFDKGYTIKLFTARFMGRNNDNISLAKKQGLKFTKLQLKSWGIRYHKLIFGKPSFDIIIDDKSLGFKKNWYKDLKKWLKKN